MFLGLELLRVLACLAVVVWHYQHFGVDLANGLTYNNLGEYWWISGLYLKGTLAVRLFWIVSGVVFNERYGESVGGGKVSAGSFFIRRLAKLYPLHAVTLMYVAVMQWGFFSVAGRYFVYQNNDLWHFMLGICMASFWGLESGFSYNGPFWSVSLEILVYIAWFIFIKIFGFGLRSQIVVVVLTACWHFSALNFRLAECLLCFSFGNLIWWINKLSRRRFAGWQWLIGCCGGILFVVPQMIVWDWEKNIQSNTIGIIGCGIVVWASLVLGPCTVSGAGFIEALGGSTYAIYMAHFPFQLTVELICRWGFGGCDFDSVAALIVYVMAVVVLGLCLHRWCEKPLRSRIISILA